MKDSRYQSNGDLVYVIAEVGINHNGSVEQAKALIEGAARAGADGVKIQVRDLPTLYAKAILDDPLKAEQSTQYLLEELKKVTIGFDEIRELFRFAKGLDVDFFGTPFDIKSAEFLSEMKVPLFKIGSPDFTNLPLLRVVAGFDKPMILSTGMCSEAEILEVVGHLRSWNADFALLHCNSTYPASYEDIHLRYMKRLGEISETRVGYSGHERDYAPTLAAVALGAAIVERHITLDTRADGPDHSSSLSVEDFADMVVGIRRVESSLGRAEKVQNQGEQSNRVALAKSLVAARELAAGTVLREDDLVAKTPARGLSPLELPKLVGKKLARDIAEDEPVRFEDLEGGAGRVTQFDIEVPWGVVGRLNDFEEFLELRPDLIEIHLTWRDLDKFFANPTEMASGVYDQDLVVHAPEYYRDRLIDFTSDDPEVTEYSIEMLDRTVELARQLAGRFRGLSDPRGPRVVVHPGGHHETAQQKSVPEQYARLHKHIEAVDARGVRILLENMPPFPWYFGGQWYQAVFADHGEVAQFAQDNDWGICYDTSHALLYCNSAGLSLEEYSKAVLPHVEYLHVSDAKGLTQEGLQLGEGNLDFDHLFALLHQLDVGFVPEIWQGHLNRGAGFRQALLSIETLLRRKVSGHGCDVAHPANAP